MHSNNTSPRRVYIPLFSNTVAMCEEPASNDNTSTPSKVHEVEVVASSSENVVIQEPVKKSSLIQRFMKSLSYPKLSYPGSFDSIQGPVRSVLMVDAFDGFRFDLSKQMNPKFQITHFFMMGTNQIPAASGAGMYNFSAMLQHGNQMSFPNTMWNGSVDWSGRVSARVFTQWHPRFGTKINTQFSGDIDQTHMQVEGNYKGKDNDISFKYIPTQGVIEGGFLQSVTRSLAIGCGGVFVPANGVFIKSFGARYKGKGFTGAGSMTHTPQGNEYQCGYVRNVSRRTSLAADLVVSSGMMGNLNSQFSAGYSFKLKQATLSAKISNDGTIMSVLQDQTLGGYTFSLSAVMHQLDPSKLEFGFGFSFGGQ